MFEHLNDAELEGLIDGLVSAGIKTVAADRLFNRLQDEADVRSMESRESTTDPWTYN